MKETVNDGLGQHFECSNEDCIIDVLSHSKKTMTIFYLTLQEKSKIAR